MKEVYVHFIRHAESDWNINKQHLVGGRSNETPLSERGVHQAFVLGGYIGEHLERPDLVYASPAVRTMTTARIALRSAGIVRHIYVDPALQELSQGDVEGMPREQVYTDAVMRRIELEGLDFKHKGGQSLRELGTQALDWLNQEYEQRLSDFGYAYVFGHGMSIQSLVGRIEGWDHMQIYHTDVPNASYTTIAGYPGNWRIAEYAASTQLQDSGV